MKIKTIELFDEVREIRKKEIDANLNLGTRSPIYCVLDLMEHVVPGHIDIDDTTNLKRQKSECGYIDYSVECEDRVFKESPEGMEVPSEVTRFYTDRYVSFHLTSHAAHHYKTAQAHNMHKPYVFVHCEGYRCYMIEKLFDS